jgi:hypothetical protein
VSDHPRDCPHGRQWGKCDTCDLIEANKHIAALEADNERLRDVVEAAKALIADPEWCSCSTINPNSRHAHDRPNLDYPATCAICGPTYCTGRTLNDALAALDKEMGE